VVLFWRWRRGREHPNQCRHVGWQRLDIPAQGGSTFTSASAAAAAGVAVALALYLTQNTFGGTNTAVGGLGFQKMAERAPFTPSWRRTLMAQVLVDTAAMPGVTGLGPAEFLAGGDCF